MKSTRESCAKIFHTSKQEQLRLGAALTGYFLESESADGGQEDSGFAVSDPPTGHRSDTHNRQEYAAYLKKRIRAAAALLAEASDVAHLRQLDREGFFTPELKQRITQEYADGKHPAAWLSMMCLQGSFIGTNLLEMRGLSGGKALPKQKEFSGGRVLPEQRGFSGGRALREQREAFFADEPVEYDCTVWDRENGNDRATVQKLHRIRGLVYGLFPHLDAAIAALPFREKAGIGTIGTDGFFIYYNAAYINHRYETDRNGLARQYLHTLLHCICMHWTIWEKDAQQPDLLVERMIEQECKRRRECRELLGSCPSLFHRDGAEDKGYPVHFRDEKEIAHAQDDHGLWPSPSRREDQSVLDQLDKRWDFLRTLTGVGAGGNAGIGSFGIGAAKGEDILAFADLQQGKHDYRAFLGQFTVSREELVIDQDSFDYLYYTLGMQAYGSLALLEPLEYTEGHKLEELVIAMDTSGSCSEEMLRSFLEETWAILGRAENFFEHMSVWFVQCDCVVQQAVHICSREDWIRYCEELKVIGRGGTDFRPVFNLVEKLRETGEIKDLKCLLYFTDGEGIYPREKPDYEAAFVHVRRKDIYEKAPAWAVQLYCSELPM